MHLVEPTRGKDELEWGEDEESEEVERRTVSEDGVGFDTFESEYGATKLNFCSTVGDDLGEGVRKHRDEDCEEERVAKNGEGHHKDRT